MKLIGNKLVIPLFDVVLHHNDSYHLCDGISIFTLAQDYENELRSTPQLIARYEASLPYMKCGLAIEPGVLELGEKLNWTKLHEFGILIALSIRLATGIPLDIPYWFDVEDDEIKGCGNTLVSTYRDGNRYMYPVDEGKQLNGLNALQSGTGDLTRKYMKESLKNVLLRAIEFAGLGFQARHIPSRLVNNTIFLESLFSLTNMEISFQIASSVSWYLESENSTEERLELFDKIKKLYGYRSKIVHGSDISSKNRDLRKNMLFSEDLNTEIFQNILTRNHIDTFSMKQDKRQEELKKLALGAGSVFLA